MVLSYIGRAGVRGIEAILRRYYGVVEFTSDPHCILRVSRSRSPRDLVLSDGTYICKDDTLLALHFRNEQLAVGILPLYAPQRVVDVAGAADDNAGSSPQIKLSGTQLPVVPPTA